MWLRKSPVEGKSDLILYDWELCCINVPQADVLYFLVTVLPPHASPAEQLAVLTTHMEYYREQLLDALTGRDAKLIETMKNRELFDRIIYLSLVQRLLGRAFITGAFPEPLQSERMMAIVNNQLLCIEAMSVKYYP